MEMNVVPIQRAIPIPTLVAAINEAIEAGDRAKDNADQHYIKAGGLLKELKEQNRGSGTPWYKYVRQKCGISNRRANELIEMHNGRPVTEMRAGNTERQRKTRVKNRARRHARSPTKPPSFEGNPTGQDAAPEDWIKEDDDTPIESYLKNFYEHTSLARDSARVCIRLAEIVIKNFKRIPIAVRRDLQVPDESDLVAETRALAAEWEKTAQAIERRLKHGDQTETKAKTLTG
jgi:hypothetical protein